MQKTTSEMGFSENFTLIHVFSTFFFKYLLDSFLMQDGCHKYVTRIKDLVWSLGERTFKGLVAGVFEKNLRYGRAIVTLEHRFRKLFCEPINIETFGVIESKFGGETVSELVFWFRNL